MKHIPSQTVQAFRVSKFLRLTSSSKAGIIGLLDQAVVSASNFAVGLLLARKLSPSDFGAYAVVLSAILALNSIQSAFITYPLLLEYVAVPITMWRAGVKRSCIFTLASVGIQGPLLVLICAFLGVSSLIGAAIGATVLWQVHETLRRGLFQRDLHRHALFLDAVRYGATPLALAALPTNMLSPKSALYSIAGCSVIAILVCLKTIGSGSSAKLGSIREEFRRFLSLGKPVAISNLANSGLGVAITVSVGWARGLPSTSDYQVVANVISIINPIVMGLSTVLMPAVTTAYARAGTRAGVRAAAPYLWMIAILMLPPIALIIFLPHRTLMLMYGTHSPYSRLSHSLRLAAAGQILAIVAIVLAGVLNCLRTARLTCRIQLITSVLCLILAIPATCLAGVIGTFTALALTYLIRSIWLATALQRKYQRERSPEGTLRMRPIPLPTEA